MDSTVDSLCNMERVVQPGRVDFFTEAPPSWSRRHKAEVGGACDGHFASFLYHICCSRHGKTVCRLVTDRSFRQTHRNRWRRTRWSWQRAQKIRTPPSAIGSPGLTIDLGGRKSLFFHCPHLFPNIVIDSTANISHSIYCHWHLLLSIFVSHHDFQLNKSSLMSRFASSSASSRHILHQLSHE